MTWANDMQYWDNNSFDNDDDDDDDDDDNDNDCPIMIMIVAMCCSRCLCFLVLWNISIYGNKH